MDNFVTVVQGNDFTLNITLSTPNKETQAHDPYDIRDAESIEVKLVSQIKGHVLRLDPFKIVGKNVISTLVSGTKLKLTDYDVEVSFVKGGLNKRAYECNIIHVVRCQGDTDYSTQDTEGENGYGIDLTMGIDLEVVNLGKNVNGSGTLDYNNLEHKPSINDVVLEGNKTLEDLGIMGSDKAYTKEEVNQALETKADKTLVDTFSQKVDSLEESLNRKANTTDIPSRLSELENDLKTKTINSQSIFGEGNIEIPGGSTPVDAELDAESTNAIQNKAVTKAITELQDYCFPTSLEASISPSSAEWTGNSVEVSVSFRVLRNSKPVVADTVQIQFNGETKMLENVSEGSEKFILSTFGYKSGSVTAEKGTTTIKNSPMSISANLYLPVYYGFSKATTGNELTITSLTKGGSSLNGTKTLNNDDATKYLWLCVPNTMSVNKVTSGGFDVPFLAPVEASTTLGTYKCYRTQDLPGTDPMTIVIS